MNDHSGSGAQVLLAFLAGAVGGACVALLTTPQSGDQTREQLRDWAHKAQGRAVRVPTALQQAYARASVAAKEAFIEALEEGAGPQSPES